MSYVTLQASSVRDKISSHHICDIKLGLNRLEVRARAWTSWFKDVGWEIKIFLLEIVQ